MLCALCSIPDGGESDDDEGSGDHAVLEVGDGNSEGAEESGDQDGSDRLASHAVSWLARVKNEERRKGGCARDAGRAGNVRLNCGICQIILFIQ